VPRRRLIVDLQTIEALFKDYGTPIAGAALILAGIFMRLMGKGFAYLILGLGILGSLYLILRGYGSGPNPWLPVAVLAAGIAASIALALALRALTVAVEFGMFTVGWYLFLQAVPAFYPSFPVLSSVAGASTWMGFSIVTTAASEWAGRKRGIFRTRGVVPGGAASAVRFVRR
jgi:hypothetical protein